MLRQAAYDRKFLLLVLLCVFTSQMPTARGDDQGTITNATLAAYKGLCRAYAVPLGSAYLQAVQDAYTAGLTSKMAIVGAPDVIYDTPIAPAADSGQVPAWSICIPVLVTAASSATEPYKVVDIPQATAVKVTCGTSDEDRKSCADAVNNYLSQNGLSTSRMAQLETLPDDKIAITVAVSANH
jgi:hypothetical protein